MEFFSDKIELSELCELMSIIVILVLGFVILRRNHLGVFAIHQYFYFIWLFILRCPFSILCIMAATKKLIEHSARQIARIVQIKLSAEITFDKRFLHGLILLLTRLDFWILDAILSAFHRWCHLKFISCMLLSFVWWSTALLWLILVGLRLYILLW